MPWLACYNPEINWKTEEVKMIRCLDECGKQWRLKQGNQGSKNKKKVEVKKLVLEQFYKWINIFEKKVSERMLTRKM